MKRGRPPLHSTPPDNLGLPSSLFLSGAPSKAVRVYLTAHLFQNNLKFTVDVPLAQKRVEKKPAYLMLPLQLFANSNTGVFCKCTIQRAQPHTTGARSHAAQFSFLVRQCSLTEDRRYVEHKQGTRGTVKWAAPRQLAPVRYTMVISSLSV